MASDLLTPSATFLALFNRIEGNLYQGLHNFLIVEYEFVVGHYEVNNHLIQHNSKAVLSPFKSKTKRIPALVDDHGPGPGAYSPHQAPRPVKKTILPRGCYLAISEPPLIVPKDPPLPGPGQYDIGNCNGTSKHPMPTAAFASRTERLPRNSQSDMRPGPALPLQTDSQSIQSGDKCPVKDLLTPDDSAVTDLSTKTDSSPQTETPSKTDDSSKTDVRPSTPGSSSSPQPKKALPLQTDSQSIQSGDKCPVKDLLTPDDSAVTDLSTKTDSSPQTETPSKTDDSSKTDVRPSTPGSSSSPQPKKDSMSSEQRQKLAKERREERAKYIAAKKAQWLEKEDKARRLRESQLEERRRKLEEQRLKTEKRRALLEEKQRQKLEKNKERYESAIKRSTKKTWAEIRQQRWSWAGGLNQTSRRESRCSASTVNLPRQVDPVINNRLSKSSATLWNSPNRTRSLRLSPWESRIVERLMTPTLSFLARSRSAATLLNSSDSPSASPLNASSHHHPHRNSAERWRVSSASTPDITQRQRRRNSTPLDKKKKEKKDKERENEKEKNSLSSERVPKRRQTTSPATTITRSSTPKPKKRPPSPAAPKSRPLSPLVQAAASKTPVGKKTPPPGTKTRPKRAQTPARVQPQTVTAVAVETGHEPQQPDTPEEKKTSTNVPAIVVSTARVPPPSPSPPLVSDAPPAAPGVEPRASAASPAAASASNPAPSAAPAAAVAATATAAASTPAPAAAAPANKPSAGTNNQEEAARVLAEKRRQAREQREREEQERLEQEQRNRILREEAMVREAEERKRREEEARFMAEQQRLRDDAERAQEEKEAQEENERVQRQREEAEAKAREEAERQRVEREKHFQKEEQERLERKKRLEEIMKRTRKSDAGEKVSQRDLSKTSLKKLNLVLSSPGSQQGVSSPVGNGVQPAAHQNGVSARGEAADFEEIIQLNKSGNAGQQQSGLVGEPILAFEGAEPFLMKTGPMKPQHVAEVL
ncbi:hypothetical protein F2P81_023225 [Scophthalmus maximus]|uniref:MAP7 domain-containing protein 1-like n=1 Tax=Scophthalmus maximus TaxID=52904 RepID=A0A6A4RQX4_SCOMX|nr:hypothetical protein F2P81_023225 [Scophthalmus maximus]